ncbi:MAG: ATP synthase F1 subunit delta [Bacteroidales bacterium]|nr:ATP synthase F1 subunit delta [Bacteroidales bacterium]
MNEGLIPGRYAKALYKYATEQHESEAVYGQMKQLAASYVAEAALRKVVGNKFLPYADKEKVLLSAAQATSGSCLSKFIRLVFDNNREDFMREIALAYLKIYRIANNIAQVEIVSAHTLGADQLNKIIDVVERQLRGKQIEQTTRVDADLIGGFVIKADDQLLDASIKNELKKLRLQLLSK